MFKYLSSSIIKEGLLMNVAGVGFEVLTAVTVKNTSF
jgi:hypothetical protein